MTSGPVTFASPADKRAFLAKLLKERVPQAEPPQPLSEGQRALWFMYQLAPENTSFNLGEAVRVRGPLDADALQRALNRVVARHPQLRTRFFSAGDQVLQRVLNHRPVAIDRRDAETWPQERVQAALKLAVDTPFNLQSEPPLRMSLFRRNSEEHILVFALHHIAAEFWTLIIVIKELLESYRHETLGGPDPLQPLSATYADFVKAEAAMLSSATAEEHWAYWKEQLAGELPGFDFPTDSPRHSAQTHRGGLCSFTLDSSLLLRVRQFARKQGVTTYVVLLAAYAAQLHRYTGQRDLVIGAPMTGRGEARFAGVVGYFDNPLPLRIAWADDATGGELIARVKATVLGAFEHQAYPLPRIVERLRAAGASPGPLYQTMFVFRQSPIADAQDLTAFGMGGAHLRIPIGPGITIEPAGLERSSSQFALALSIAEARGQFFGSWEYSSDLFERATIDELSAGYATVLAALIDDPSASLESLPCLSQQTRSRILYDWNATQSIAPTHSFLHEPFQEMARHCPDALAVIAGDVRLTYRDLDRRANAVAHWLTDHGAKPNELVAIQMNKSWTQIVAAIAVSKSGAAYLPLDAQLPPSRLLHLLERGRVRLVLTQHAVEERFRWPDGLERLAVDTMGDCEDALVPPASAAKTDDLAYAIFTSGSTGAPKGVMIDHRGPLNTILDVNRRIDLRESDRVLALSSLSFDLSVWDIFGTLAAGAAIVVPDASRASDPGHWHELLQREQITVWNSVPNLLKLAVEHAERRPERTLAPLRIALLSGDWIPLDLPDRYRALAPGSRVVSMGGATEGSIWSIWYEIGDVDRRWKSVPYGQPMDNQAFYVLNRALEPCPVGTAGDLYIGGIGVTKGYWEDEEKTRAAIVEHPEVGRIYRTGDRGRFGADGTIEFLGRNDFQVKIRGFRVELGEIESTLKSHPDIGDALVVATDGSAGTDRRLVAYVVAQATAFPAATELRRFLTTRLPDYMIPAFFVELKALPLNSNGKIDRSALPPPPAGRPLLDVVYQGPNGAVETALAAIWSEVLGFAEIGVHDNFFALGGDSIRAIQVVARASDRGLTLSSRQLFEHPTIAELAPFAASGPTADVLEGTVALPLLEQQARLVRSDDVSTCVLGSEFPIDAIALESALDWTIRRHDALRIAVDEGSATQTVASLGAHGPVPRCASVQEAIEQARRRIDLREGVALRAALAPSNLLEGVVIVAHGAAIDRGSWGPILTDLLGAYRSIARGAAPVEAPPPASFRAWARRNQERLGVGALPPRAPGAAAKHRCVVQGDLAEAILHHLPSNYRVAPEVLLLAALAMTSREDRDLVVKRRAPLGERRACQIDGAIGPMAWAARCRLSSAADVGTAFGAAVLALRHAQPGVVTDGDTLVEFDWSDPCTAFAPHADWSLLHLSDPLPPSSSRFVSVCRMADVLAVTCESARGDAQEVAEGIARALETVARGGDALASSLAEYPWANLDDADTKELAPRRALLDDVYPLSPMQETMLLHGLHEPDSALYCEHVFCKWEGTIEPKAFESAVRALCASHSALRTGFVWEGLRRPLQVVEKTVPVDVHFLDWSSFDEKRRRDELDELVRHDRRRGFDLAKPPLLRWTVIRTGADSAEVVICHHHLLFDGWSLTLLLQDFMSAYDAAAAGVSWKAEERVSFAEHIRWLGDLDFSAAREFWSGALRGRAISTLAIADRPAPARVGAFEHGEAERFLSQAATTRLLAFAREMKTTPSIVVEAAWALCMRAYAGGAGDEVVFGVTVAGRPEDLPGFDRMVGLFINTVPLEVSFAERPSVRELIERIRAAHLAMRPYEQVRPREIDEWSRKARTGSFAQYQSVVIYENYPTDASLVASRAHVRMSDVRFTEQTNTPFALYVIPGPQLALRATFDRRLFDASTAERIVSHVEALLERLSGEPNSPAESIDILSEPERRRLLVEFNGMPKDFGPPECLHTLLAAQAERTPRATALTCGDTELSYAQLDGRANRIARYLQRAGVGHGDRVALLMHRSLDLIAAIFGILKAGACYVPIDPDTPRERVAFIIGDAHPAAILHDRSLASSLSGVDIPAIDIQGAASELAALSDRRIDGEVAPSDLAYVIYTSGSTGNPKGVLIEHRAVYNYVRAAIDAYGLCAEDRVLQFFSIAFDASVEEIFPILSCGGTLVLRPDDLLDTMGGMIRRLGQMRISVASLPTAVWHVMTVALAESRAALPPGLRTVIIGGERALSHRLEEWRRLVGASVRLFNTYGPTETTIVATMDDLSSETAIHGDLREVSIGRPVANVSAYVCAPDGRLAPLGVPGELYLGGVQVARGYLDRPALTTQRFVPNPFDGRPSSVLYRTGDLARYRDDGRLEFVGRVDNQVKIRGFRVEVEEIETNLAGNPEVAGAAVSTYVDANETLGLAAYVVLRPEARVASGELRARLRAALPEYMVPSAITFLPALPLNERGKVDRRALPAIAGPLASDSFVAPRNEKEKSVADAWASVLRVERVGIDDNFFDIGGHSLLAVQLLSRVRDVLGVEISLRDFFSAPTVSQMVQLATAPLPSVDMVAESALDLEVPPNAPPATIPPREVLLTGGIGFLGSYLLRDLLDGGCSRVHCLVRARTKDEAERRLDGALARFGGLARYGSDRIQVVCGDLAEPRFGLDEERFDALAARIDAVVHSGAAVNFVLPYERLRAVNVTGTREVLKFATQRRLKALHYVSTLSVFPTDPEGPMALEEDLAPDPGHLTSGYAQSKWVAERLVLAARRAGLPVVIYRPGRITGDGATGAWNGDDLVCRMIKACIDCRAAPMLDIVVDMTPVDFVSRAIVETALNPSHGESVLHLVNPKPARLQQILKEVEVIGFPLEKVTLEDWLARVEALMAGDAEHPFRPLVVLLPQWADSMRPSSAHATRYDARRTTAALASTGLVCPPVGGDLLRRYLNYLVSCGFISLPTAVDLQVTLRAS